MTIRRTNKRDRKAVREKGDKDTKGIKERKK
jgi:hypothetical protein